MPEVDRYNDLVLQIAFARLKGNGMALGTQILDKIGDERRFFGMSERQLQSTLNAQSPIFDDTYRHTLLERAVRQARHAEQINVDFLYYTDSRYPQRLTNCPDAPLGLFIAGDTDLNAAHIISIVGTRRATSYGTSATAKFVSELAAIVPSLVIVSGLAYGIDVAAHRAALDAGIPTVAVSAVPLDRIYPEAHRPVAVKMIRQGGAILTEYDFESHTNPSLFLARNRIVAGMCDCLLVMESDNKGGSMTTASLANSYDREVFALPGRTTDQYSRGCNRLIADNLAHLLTEPRALAEYLGWAKDDTPVQRQLPLDLTEQQQDIIGYLSANADSLPVQIASALSISLSEAQDALFQLELMGCIESTPAGGYNIAQ